jgi:hypothetical protein
VERGGRRGRSPPGGPARTFAPSPCRDGQGDRGGCSAHRARQWTFLRGMLRTAVSSRQLTGAAARPGATRWANRACQTRSQRPHSAHAGENLPNRGRLADPPDRPQSGSQSGIRPHRSTAPVYPPKDLTSRRSLVRARDRPSNESPGCERKCDRPRRAHQPRPPSDDTPGTHAMSRAARIASSAPRRGASSSSSMTCPRTHRPGRGRCETGRARARVR